MLISFNGVLTDADDKIFSSHSRIYKYGDGFFESIKIINKVPQHFNLHYSRITRAAKLFKIHLNEKWTQGFFNDQLNLLCLKNGLVNARCRITFYRDSQGFYTPVSNKGSFIIELSEDNGVYHLNDKGLTLGTYGQILKPSNFVSFFKPLSAINYVMAGIAAMEQNCDSVVLFNESNRICEVHNANIFIFRDGEIITPSLSEYCLDGVMRQFIINKCKAMNKEVFEEELTEEALLMADEVFVTNASKGMQWVESYGGKFYSFEKVQQLFSEIF
ncbi:MAG: aminotransferase class IV [bacterium]|nr:aminotransferase class IV [bacterium]